MTGRFGSSLQHQEFPLRALRFKTFAFLAVILSACLFLSAAETIDFDAAIRPILSDRCFACHGPDANARQADLRLDDEDAAKEYAVVAGDADASELFLRISSDDPDCRMPPPDSKLSLTEQEIASIRDWIQQGAHWQQHWSFVPVPDVPVPRPDDSGWIRNPIDGFVLQKLREHGLTPSVSADRSTLLRRVTLAITGLPPTLTELDGFLADDDADAYEKAVDRLLRSARYGERMAADWLDVARYSDTYGYQVDRDRFVWPYRDWVIRAWNQNMPYDQFVTEQLAGDLLPDATEDQILATTFNRLHSQEAEGGSIPEEFRIKSVSDRTETFSTALLGLTMECCRCHDHKFDPLSQKDYYQVSAFFDNIDEAGLYSYFTSAIPTPSLLLPTDEQRQTQSALRSQIELVEREIASMSDDRREEFEAWLRDGSRHEPPSPPVLHLDFEKPPAPPNEHAEGPSGSAVRLSGDDGIVTDVGNFACYDPFSVALWLQIPDAKERAVVFHRSRAWTDAGSRGYELLIKDGRLQAALIHFWPGNAIAIQTRDIIPTQQWLHVTVTYDGSSRAGGLALFMNGERVDCDVVRDNLSKNIKGGGGDTITIGARFRDRGFTDGLVDEFHVFDRELTRWEVRCLCADPLSLPSPPFDGGEGTELVYPYYLATQDQAYRRLQGELRELRRQLTQSVNETAEIMVMRELPTQRASFLLVRGNYDARGEQVDPQTPSVLGGTPLQPANRLGLARWLTDPNHPLTARVQVNRIWQLLFGYGLVRTPEDFGRQGARPTHPDLLDWLASDFIKHGWDVKRLIKQIVMSATYQQTSVASRVMIERDPDNRWLTRGPSFRLPAEMLRDQALAVSGLLVERCGGPPVKPYDVAEAFTPVERDRGEGLYRRSVYTYWKRTGPAPVMTTFDASPRDVCRVRRERTSTPLQALVLLNGPQFVEASRALAQRVLERHGEDSSAALAEMFRALTSRAPRQTELKVMVKLFDRELDYFLEHGAEAEQFLQVGDFQASEAIDPARLAAAAIVANTLVSYDEVQMMR